MTPSKSLHSQECNSFPVWNGFHHHNHCSFFTLKAQTESVNWPITETSYSISSVASCPHCFRMLMASDRVLPWRRIPSMLSNRSPGFTVPSLERERGSFSVCTEAPEGQKPFRQVEVTHLSAGPPGLMVVMTMGRDLFLSSWAPPTSRKMYLFIYLLMYTGKHKQTHT